MDPLIEASGMEVCASRDQHVLLSGVDWKIAPGDYWVVGGPHGSGKTDLLATTAGLQRSTAGSVRIFGREVKEMTEPELLKQRTRLGVVFKNGGRMFPDLTVAENVALPLCYHRNWRPEQAQAEVRAMLEITELDGMAKETAQSLGSGWPQRVGLARALALKPEILFLDEPGMGLDSRQRLWWRHFLGQLSSGTSGIGKEKTTVVATTNDFSLWQGERRLVGLIKDKHWQILGEQAEYPQIT
ncbi:MAG TPA: ATP-binding cassette domain-containing protein [Candidatus Saccharimonadales bacterium]|nr:ATP-binding cassette domain-containing protein [Candidatus Saccharimonadales bacterium]